MLGALWLLFFPNAPYIATDFVHLQHDPLAPFWYDAVTIAAFAWMGVLLGFASLYLMQTVVRQWRGVGGRLDRSPSSRSALGSLGIYLGRFLRLNSWDALEHPSVLPRIAARRRARPVRVPGGDRGDVPVHARADVRLLPALQLRPGLELDAER